MPWHDSSPVPIPGGLEGWGEAEADTQSDFRQEKGLGEIKHTAKQNLKEHQNIFCDRSDNLGLDVVEEETWKMLKKVEKLQKKKEEISKEVRKKKKKVGSYCRGEGRGGEDQCPII